MRKDQQKLGRWRRTIGMSFLERRLWEVYRVMDMFVLPTRREQIDGVVMNRGITGTSFGSLKHLGKKKTHVWRQRCIKNEGLSGSGFGSLGDLG